MSWINIESIDMALASYQHIYGKIMRLKSESLNIFFHELAEGIPSEEARGNNCNFRFNF